MSRKPRSELQVGLRQKSSVGSLDRGMQRSTAMWRALSVGPPMNDHVTRNEQMLSEWKGLPSGIPFNGQTTGEETRKGRYNEGV